MDKDYMSILSDQNNDRYVDWAGKKIGSQRVAESYCRLDPHRVMFRSKIERISQCGDILEFKLFSDDSMKLYRANFCKNRLCPMCTWRRSLKIFGQMSQIMDAVPAGFSFLFLTLTIRNVPAADLSATITDMFSGFSRLLRRKKVAAAVHGTFRTLEVTRNFDTGEYHPHIHSILLVRDSYFKGGVYISQAEFTDLWKKSMKLDYNPIVHIQRFKGNIKKGILEASKYSVKPNDYIFDDPDLMDQIVFELDDALFKRRLLSFTGEFLRIRKALNLADPEDGDLVHTDIQDLRDDLAYIIVRYRWNVGFGNYIFDA